MKKKREKRSCRKRQPTNKNSRQIGQRSTSKDDCRKNLFIKKERKRRTTKPKSGCNVYKFTSTYDCKQIVSEIMKGIRLEQITTDRTMFKEINWLR